MRTWRPVRPELSRELTDARLQLHHAAQLVAAMGISYLPKQSDDSHTNLEWLDDAAALASHTINDPTPIRLAVRPHPFALLFLREGEPRATLELNGCTIERAIAWVRQQLAAAGVDAARYTNAKHYAIPPHAVAASASFSAAASDAFEQLSFWYSNAALILGDIAARTPNSSPVRCWPHHFDIATLIEVASPQGNAPAKTTGVGMEPGDTYYDEPYFYVNMYPQPSAVPTMELDGRGSWHAREWLGAVLPASQVGSGDQHAQIDAFLRSAMQACRAMLTA